MTELAGYFASLLIGLSLGLIGGGGSILTVPVLVFLFGVRPVDATAHSLIVVGATALVAAADYARRGLVDLRTAISFAIPSVAGVYLMRRVIVPAVPDVLFAGGPFEMSKDRMVLVAFGLLMLAASLSMIRQRSPDVETSTPVPSLARWAAQGFAIGVVTGAVGAGGGFLIVPALVLIAKAPMKRAVATSLVVIAINSLLGFVGDLQAGRAFNWALIGAVVALAIVGAVVGGFLARFIPAAKLKPAFGYFVLVTGGFVVASGLTNAAPSSKARSTPTTQARFESNPVRVTGCRTRIRT